MEVGKCDELPKIKADPEKSTGGVIALVLGGIVYTYILCEGHVLYIIFF